MEESADLHEEASIKENKQTVPINLSPAEQQQSKNEVEIAKFLQEQKSKNIQYKTWSDFNERVEEILSHWKSLEQLKRI